MADKLTKEERAWLHKVQKLLDQMPERFGFYTIGDPDLSIFDRTLEHLFDSERDMVGEVFKHDADIGRLYFKANVHGVCG